MIKLDSPTDESPTLSDDEEEALRLRVLAQVLDDMANINSDMMLDEMAEHEEEWRRVVLAFDGKKQELFEAYLRSLFVSIKENLIKFYTDNPEKITIEE